MDFRPFKIGKYVLMERIATGGMAEVYRAKASGAGGFEKQLAVKRIIPTYSQNEEFRRMFEYEARLSSMLTHANIVQVYDFEKYGDTYLLSMEFVDGKNLRQVINKAKKRNQPISIEASVFIINEVCKGLDYAHKKHDDILRRPLNIIHRDMSPQNIMLSYDGAAKIVDFGIAKAKDRVDETRSGVIKGKFGYMSPEQASGETVDHRTDIFSTGIILYELVTGKRLFAAENDMQTLKRIQECIVQRPTLINPKIPIELEKIVLKALSKDLTLRFQSAGGFHRKLQEFLSKYYPSYSVRDSGELLQTLFEQEIILERKRIEQVYRQSIPFSQGHDRTAPLDEVEEALDRDITKSEHEPDTIVTEDGIIAQDDESVESIISQEASALTNANTKASNADKPENTIVDEIPIDGAQELSKSTDGPEYTLETQAGGLSQQLEINELSNSPVSDESNAEHSVTEAEISLGEEAGFEAIKDLEENFPEPSKSLEEPVDDHEFEKTEDTLVGQKVAPSVPIPDPPPPEPEHPETLDDIDLSESQPQAKAPDQPADEEISLVTKADDIVLPKPTLDKSPPTPNFQSPPDEQPPKDPEPQVSDSALDLDFDFNTNSDIIVPQEPAPRSGSSARRAHAQKSPPYRAQRQPLGPARLLLSLILVTFILVGGAVIISVWTSPPAEERTADPRDTTQVDPSAGTQSAKKPSQRTTAGEPACVVRVYTDPPEAKLIVNKEPRGKTPTSVSVPCNRASQIEIQKDGYLTIRQNRTVKEKENSIWVTLQKIPQGKLKLTLSHNAQVYIDGNLVGEATRNQPFELALPSNRVYRLTFINKALNISESKDYKIKKNVVIKERVTLDRKPANRSNR